MRDDQDEQEEREERPRPKVVDKRISARQAAGPAEATGPADPAAPAPDPEPAPTAEATIGSVPEAETAQERQPGGPPGEGVWTPEQEAEARRVAEEIARTPSVDWVINTAVTLGNVAGAKLDLGAAEDAQLAIDAMAAIVNGVGPRLEAAERPLRQLLAELQLAYAQRVTGPPDGPGAGPSQRS